MDTGGASSSCPWRALGLGLLVAVLATLAALAARYRRKLYVVAKTLPRDLRYLLLFVRLVRGVRRFQQDNVTTCTLFKRTVRRHPDKTCFLFEGKAWTFKEVDALSNRVARVFAEAGLSRGDAVALVMGNRPEYVCVWLGLAQLGVVTALINTNLRDAPLAHCLNAASVKAVIVDPEMAAGVLEVRDQLTSVPSVYQLDGDPSAHDGVLDLGVLLDAASPTAPEVDFVPAFNDPILYIFTSGTTGMPKAAILPHSKITPTALAVDGLLKLSPDADVVYCPLPLYHSAGGVYCLGIALFFAVPVVIVKKFSASRFWSDCIKYNATAAQYIGELCRYLTLVPESPLDTQHRVRLMFGNGLQPAVWRTMQTRFKVARIAEGYAATEGNANIINNDINAVGSVGFLPRCVPLSCYPIAIVRVHPESGEPVRDPSTGRCIRCEDDEVGMLIGQIREGNPSREFFGYLDREATEKKIMMDVFVEGDRYFMTGDMMVMDEFGFVYFKDRTGDTFRWKGENVSTTEVETVLSTAVRGIHAVAVYGVQVAGHEGRVGMAAIADPERRVDLDELAVRLARMLPSYARPAFLRVADALPTTGTLKVTKTTLKREAFDLSSVRDPLYFLDPRAGKYVRLTQDILDDIESGKVRL